MVDVGVAQTLVAGLPVALGTDVTPEAVQTGVFAQCLHRCYENQTCGCLGAQGEVCLQERIQMSCHPL